jgi:homoserine kinase type II
MAVYTDISDDELAVLLAGYGLGQARAFKGIAEGVENSNFLLETEAGRFILTIFEKRVARADLPFFMAVMERLAQQDFPAPRPMRTKDGGLLGEVRGKACAIVTFLTGVSPKRPNAAQCRAIGVKLAQMHRALDGFTPTRANALAMAAWAPIITPRLGLAESLRAGLADAVRADLAALAAGWPAGLPRGIIHEDLFPDNALFLGDEVRGVIDYYFACEDALAYDLAVCLNAWAFEPDRSFNITKGQALIAGYESIRPLTHEERAARPCASSPPACARGTIRPPARWCARRIRWNTPTSSHSTGARRTQPTMAADRAPPPAVALLRRAIVTHRQVVATYHGHPREFCPHILGVFKSEWRVLGWQFGGGSGRGLEDGGAWRCFVVADLKDADLRRGPWRRGAFAGYDQACIDTVDTEIDEAFAPRVRRRG